MEAWDGGLGACAGGPHHHTHGDRMLLQLSKGKKRGKNSRGGKGPFSMRERAGSALEAGLWQDLALLELGGLCWIRDKPLL